MEQGDSGGPHPDQSVHFSHKSRTSRLDLGIDVVWWKTAD